MRMNANKSMCSAEELRNSGLWAAKHAPATRTIHDWAARKLISSHLVSRRRLFIVDEVVSDLWERSWSASSVVKLPEALCGRSLSALGLVRFSGIEGLGLVYGPLARCLAIARCEPGLKKGGFRIFRLTD